MTIILALFVGACLREIVGMMWRDAFPRRNFGLKPRADDDETPTGIGA